MTQEATVERLLQRIEPGIRLDWAVLARLLRDAPGREELAAELANADPEAARAAVVFLGLSARAHDAGALALCLHHDDQTVVRLAEHFLWALWMRSGSPAGNARLAAAIAHLRADRTAEAVEELRELVREEPAFAEAHFQLALALHASDELGGAEEAYMAALRLNPYHFAAAAALGHVHVERGAIDAAMHYYRQALRIHPRVEGVPEALGELASLAGPPCHTQ